MIFACQVRRLQFSTGVIVPVNSFFQGCRLLVDVGRPGSDSVLHVFLSFPYLYAGLCCCLGKAVEDCCCFISVLRRVFSIEVLQNLFL